MKTHCDGDAGAMVKCAQVKIEGDAIKGAEAAHRPSGDPPRSARPQGRRKRYPANCRALHHAGLPHFIYSFILVEKINPCRSLH
jgi:hypothetical protein